MRPILLRSLLRTTRNPRFLQPQTRSLLTLSHSKGPTTPLLDITLGDHLAGIAGKYGDRNAVISHHQNKILTYDNLHTQSTNLAASLARRLGVKKGDIVAVSLGNTVEYTVIQYALFKLGAVLVPLNPSFNEQQITAALLHLSCSHLIFSAETKLPRKAPRPNVPLLQSLIPTLETSPTSQNLPSLKSVTIVDNTAEGVDISHLKGAGRYEDLITEGEALGYVLKRLGRGFGEDLRPDEVVNIQFTSGTTSSPKAAQLTHKGILNNGKSIGDRMALTEYDTVCCPPPLFHCFGSVLGFLACTTHASAIVFPSESFNPNLTLEAVIQHKCTALHGVPTMFTACLELLHHNPEFREKFKNSKLRTGIASGSSVPEELMKRIERELGLNELTICYGMTETSPVSLMTHHLEPDMEMRTSSVGTVLDNVEVKVVDKDDYTKILPPGEKGELTVSGYSVMTGYYGDPVRTDEAIKVDSEGKRWMHTGDEALITEKGYVKITGRIKDLIIRGGENIHPLEIENCLLAHPGVAEVTVAGLPCPKYGEVVAAFVRVCEGTEIIPTPSTVSPSPTTSSVLDSKVPVSSSGDLPAAETDTEAALLQAELRSGKKMSTEEVRRWVRERLSGHLVPKYVFWVEGYPKTASGKVQRFALKELGMQWEKDGKGL